ncbi:MAG: SCO family protein [Planctomycetota bacterium]
MNKKIPMFLWSLVVIAGAWVIYFSQIPATSDSQSGIAFKDIDWKKLQSIPRFQFTNQKGEQFDSADHSGRPMVVSFFFSTCPTICRDLNRQIQELREQLDDPEMMFTTISVDPDVDTPEVLEKYADDFGAEVADWNFLTGPLYQVKELGSHAFNVSIDKFTHTDNILLVDRWGKYRDRFKWDDPSDMKRFLKVARGVLAEKSPPLDSIVHTRNVMAGVNPPDLDAVPWIREFHLTTQDQKPFFSRDLTGEVWVASFFFVVCPGVCVEQNRYIEGLQGRLEVPAKFVSISTDPGHDTPERLKEYARKFNANLENWTFLTGEEKLIERLSAEYFKAYSSGGHHSTLLFVVDKWGNVRGQFDWREPIAEIQMTKLLAELNDELLPPGKFERVDVQQLPKKSDDVGH